LARLAYQASHGFDAEVPTFDIWVFILAHWRLNFSRVLKENWKSSLGIKALNLTEWCKLQSQHWQMFHSLIKEKKVWNSDFPIGCLCRAKLHMILIVYSLQIDHRYLISVFDYWQKPFLHWSLCR
jgi:hypothetical protein